jgi:pimeloyl-ACP methyl ester carboxylesterase
MDMQSALMRAAERASLKAARLILPRASRAIRLPDRRRPAGAGTDLVETRTGDGVTLGIERIRPIGERQGVVILQHGLSGNGAPFTLTGRSLAGHLAALGYECYIPDLRGARFSERPRSPWGIDEYVTQDIPAILRAVRGASGAETVSWVGHSLGGLLLYFYVIENPDAPIDRAVTVGSAIDYRAGKSMYRDLRRLLPLADGLRYVPYGHLARLTSPFAGYGPILPPERINFFRSNIEPEFAARLLREFHHIPVQLFRSLDTGFSEVGFHRDEGRVRYLERTADYRIPTLFLAGSRDPHCPLEAVGLTAEILGNHPGSQLLSFGREHGHVDEYGHFDMIVGRRAEQEVWPHLVKFLAARG